MYTCDFRAWSVHQPGRSNADAKRSLRCDSSCGGNAALCAALSAREHGANVLVIERGARRTARRQLAYTGGADFAWCTTAWRTGKRSCRISPRRDREHGLRRIHRRTVSGRPRARNPVALRSRPRRDGGPQSTGTVQWLHGRGVRFVPRFGRYAFKHEGKFKFFGGTVVEAAGGGRGSCRPSTPPPRNTACKCATAPSATGLIRGRGHRGRAHRSAMAQKRKSGHAPSCSRPAVSKRTANGARAISVRAGTWRRYAGPATTRATASGWRSTSARRLTVSGPDAIRFRGNVMRPTSASSIGPSSRAATVIRSASW